MQLASHRTTTCQAKCIVSSTAAINIAVKSLGCAAHRIPEAGTQYPVRSFLRQQYQHPPQIVQRFEAVPGRCQGVLQREAVHADSHEGIPKCTFSALHGLQQQIQAAVHVENILPTFYEHRGLEIRNNGRFDYYVVLHDKGAIKNTVIFKGEPAFPGIVRVSTCEGVGALVLRQQFVCVRPA